MDMSMSSSDLINIIKSTDSAIHSSLCEEIWKPVSATEKNKKKVIVTLILQFIFLDILSLHLAILTTFIRILSLYLNFIHNSKKKKVSIVRYKLRVPRGENRIVSEI